MRLEFKTCFLEAMTKTNTLNSQARSVDCVSRVETKVYKPPSHSYMKVYKIGLYTRVVRLRYVGTKLKSKCTTL